MAPGTVDGVRDGREGGDGFVHAGVFEKEGERAVAAHAVAGYGDAGRVELGVGGEEGRGEFFTCGGLVFFIFDVRVWP